MGEEEWRQGPSLLTLEHCGGLGEEGAQGEHRSDRDPAPLVGSVQSQVASLTEPTCIGERDIGIETDGVNTCYQDKYCCCPFSRYF